MSLRPHKVYHCDSFPSFDRINNTNVIKLRQFPLPCYSLLLAGGSQGQIAISITFMGSSYSTCQLFSEFYFVCYNKQAIQVSYCYLIKVWIHIVLKVVLMVCASRGTTLSTRIMCKWNYPP